jgi:acyl-CoA synthetase (AMP-forming)/AMP-acid ligase II
LKGLSDTHATLTWSPNFGFALSAERVRDEEIQGVRLDQIRAFWNAAERIHPESVSSFYERFKSYGLRRESLKTAYGLAENIGAATFSDLNSTMIVENLNMTMLQEKNTPQVIEHPSGDCRSVSIVGVGRPCPGMKVKILGAGGRVLQEGNIGQVAFKTPSSLTGYLGDTRSTRRALRRGLLCTGDLGYVRRGELFWVGRRRERITTLGKKLDPSDFEHILAKISGLRNGCFAAFGVDDVEMGTQRIVVASEVRDSTDRSYRDLAGDIRSQIYLGLGVKVHEVILVPSGTLTKTSSGKRRHLHFRELYQSGQLQQLSMAGKNEEKAKDNNLVQSAG